MFWMLQNSYYLSNLNFDVEKLKETYPVHLCGVDQKIYWM